jgi:hypothetical protein
MLVVDQHPGEELGVWEGGGLRVRFKRPLWAYELEDGPEAA